MSNIKELAKTIETKRKELRDIIKAEGEKEIKATLRELFVEHPTLEAIRWRQYTPYFNDGEPCIFGVHGVYFKVVNVPKNEGDYEDGFVDSYSSKRFKLDSNIVKAVGAFEDAIQTIDKGMEDIFGDHVSVTCTRDGIEVEDYDHD